MTKTKNLRATCTLQLCKKGHKPGENSFETVVAEAVDESFSLFEHSSRQAIYFHLENTFKIKKQEIPYKIEEFANAIEQIFGVGAKLIEIRVIEALHKRIQDFVHLPKKRELVFTEYVTNLHTFLNLHTF